MIPSQAQLHHSHWGHPPSFDYHFKHSFAWPHPPAGAAGIASEAAGSGAGSGAAAAVESAAATSRAAMRGMHYHNYYHGRGGWGRPRFGMGRRFFWFGIGALAATWYYKHQEHKRQWERAIAYPSTGANVSATADIKSSEPGQEAWARHYEWHWPPHHHNHHHQQQSTPPQPQQSSQSQYKPVVSHPPNYTPTNSEKPTDAQIQSAILAELGNAHTTPGAQAAESPKTEATEDRSRRWGWGERRRKWKEEREAQRAQANAAVSQEATASKTTATTKTDSEAEMKKLREAVEAVWEEKRAAVTQAQDKLNDQAREYAKQKVDKLSAALEALRDSLEQNTDRKIKKSQEKWV